MSNEMHFKTVFLMMAALIIVGCKGKGTVRTEEATDSTTVSLALVKPKYATVYQVRDWAARKTIRDVSVPTSSSVCSPM